ncbi:MAG: BtaA family protein [Pirellulaceae bacterium]
MLFMNWISGRVFNFVHRNHLVYNTCWEDPRLDRVALELGPEDDVLVITSAGCNALDYSLAGPRHVYAVDMNPRQNALLELKLAGIRNLPFETFFQMFGQGHLDDVRTIYKNQLRAHLTSWSQNYWDRWIKFFDHPRKSFYYRGTSGTFARVLRVYTDRILKIRSHIDDILKCESLEEQRDIYQRHVRDRVWSRLFRFALKRDTTLSMVGVPKAQRDQVDKQYNGGIAHFAQDCMDSVFCEIPVSDNYFWRVYMTGSYTPECCPEYLKEANFQKLKDGLVDNISVHTNSVQGFLENHPGTISRFVLLDHMDWLSDRFFPLLEAEWQAIVDRAAPNSRVIWRSGGLNTDFLNQVHVQKDNQFLKLPELLEYHQQLAEELHAKDRVHTYGGFFIADLAA